MMKTRRDFLKISGAAVAVGSTTSLPQVFARAGLHTSPRADETILVAIQMTGGNDGLNTVIPYRDDDYHRQRPTLAFKEPQVIRVQDGWGFHPALQPWMKLWEEGRLAVVQAVGYPQPSGSHERSMEIWQTARPEDPLADTGWLGRCLDIWGERPSSQEFPVRVRGVFTGQIAMPPTVIGRNQSAVRCQRPAELFGYPRGQAELANLRDLLARPAENTPAELPLLAWAATARKEAAAQLARLEEALSRSNPGEFPSTYFGQQLSCVATLLRADLGIRIFCVDLGGAPPGSFDTHALQAANHGALLGELAGGLAAFVKALQDDGLLDRVVIYTYSEFGRTIRENGRKGTDHGSAAPVFVLGGPIRGGLHGDHPPLHQPENGGVKHLIDFRSLYATLLDRWLNVPSQAILGAEYPQVPVLG